MEKIDIEREMYIMEAEEEIKQLELSEDDDIRFLFQVDKDKALEILNHFETSKREDRLRTLLRKYHPKYVDSGGYILKFTLAEDLFLL